MKKLLFILAAALCVTSVSAQKISGGIRVGAGEQIVGQYQLDDKFYVEARFGLAFNNPSILAQAFSGKNYSASAIYDALSSNTLDAYKMLESLTDPVYLTASAVTVDFTALYNMHIFKDKNWTPGLGKWFLDAGAGVNVGGRKFYAYAGVAAMARFGVVLKKLPVTVSVDWTPVFGPAFYYSTSDYGEAFTKYHTLGLANIGITAVYNF